MIKLNYCKNCVYPESAVNLNINEHGICSACEAAEGQSINSEEFWNQRKLKFDKLISSITKNNKSNYDCLIPVSGGKDSYYQTHIMCEEYGLKPLLVTYHGNNFLEVGDKNRDNMRNAFDADHIVWGPSVEVLKKLNKLAFNI